MTFLRKLALAAVIPAAMAAAPASADLVNTWSYKVDNGFKSFTQNPCTRADLCADSAVDATDPNADLFDYATRLEWGVPVAGGDGRRSALSVTTPVEGDDLITNGGPQNGAVLTHENHRLIRGGHNLATATLTTRLVLTPFDPPSDNPRTLIADFDINFRETPNVAGSCPTPDPFDTPCSDIFTISPEDVGSLVQVFEFDGFIYTVQLGVTGLGPLSNAQCAAAGVANGCIGFITEEESDNTFQAFFQISARPVEISEPASLALLGLSVAGLGFAGKLRRRAAK